MRESAISHNPQPSVIERFCSIRQFTEQLAAPLGAEDCAIQSMPDVSPTRWHLAHTTWFFETFVLTRASRGYQPFHPAFQHLYNSYYNTIGEQFPRDRRGVLSRPTLDQVMEYRRHVDRHMGALLPDGDPCRFAAVIELGIHHEQQHQELILTDIKHVLSCNPLHPVYREAAAQPPMPHAEPLAWRIIPEGMYSIGFDAEGFAFDNESPRHRVFLERFELADRLITNGEYLEFMESGGYRRPELWLSAGWQQVRTCGLSAPLYWLEVDGEPRQFTLSGLRKIEPREPVCHVSYFEADAFARWAGARLPTEAEWEVAAADLPIEGNFADSGLMHPLQVAIPSPHGSLHQIYGDVWEWTSSSYSPYPGYKPVEGALGEYNGKFMCNQYVLRGGSCATPKSHIRATYRNFFPPEARWQFSGIRLCR
jgi:ergothioneine biosynthesis protein EgtB